MTGENLQKSRIVFVIAPLEQQIYAIFCRDLQIQMDWIVVKLKRELKYRGYVYFKPVRPNVIYQTLNYLKTQNRFYEEIINYSGIDKHQDVAESIQKKISK